MKRLLAMAALAVAANTSHAELLLHLGMNEASGNVADSSGHNYQTEAATFDIGLRYGQASVTAGTYGAINISNAQAAQFGSSIDFGMNDSDLGNFNIVGAGQTAMHQLLSQGPAPSFLMQGSMTWMAWVNFDALTVVPQTLFTSASHAGGGGWRFAVDNTKLIFNTIHIHEATHALELDAGQWQHLAVTVGGGNVSFYRNGMLLSSTPSSFAFAEEQAFDQVKVGGFGGGTQNMFGRMDEVKIFNTALDANAIAAEALNLTPVPEPGTYALFFSGLALMGAWVKRQRSTACSSSGQSSVSSGIGAPSASSSDSTAG